MKLFCYRDMLTAQRYSYFGVTLYFVQGKPEEKPEKLYVLTFSILKSVAVHLKPHKQFDIARAIEKRLAENHPSVAFILQCIKAGVDKTACYFDAREIAMPIKPGAKPRKRPLSIAGRKDVTLALHDYLTDVQELQETICKISPEEIPPPLAFFESVQEYFIDKFADDEYFQRFAYHSSRLSECDADDIEATDPSTLQPGDFVFEIGELETATFQYYGHYQDGGFVLYHMFPGFDHIGLIRLLKVRP